MYGAPTVQINSLMHDLLDAADKRGIKGARVALKATASGDLCVAILIPGAPGYWADRLAAAGSLKKRKWCR